MDWGCFEDEKIGTGNQIPEMVFHPTKIWSQQRNPCLHMKLLISRIMIPYPSKMAVKRRTGKMLWWGNYSEHTMIIWALRMFASMIMIWQYQTHHIFLDKRLWFLTNVRKIAIATEIVLVVAQKWIFVWNNAKLSES